MIDLRELRSDPERFRVGAAAKGIDADIDGLLSLDSERRAVLVALEERRAAQKTLSKSIGPRIGELKRALKGAGGSTGKPARGQPARGEASRLEKELRELEGQPGALKAEIQELEGKLASIEPRFREAWLSVPQPPDPDVPPGTGPEDNVEIRRWAPKWFDPRKSFLENKGFVGKTHLELAESLGIVDFERGVRMAGTRSYVLCGDGARLHQAVLRLALDFITAEHGFTPLTVPVIVREECMVGTGFFPEGRDQAYHIPESARGAGHDLYLVGTGEVSLMALHAEEILDVDRLPLQYATVSTCFRREAGAAGKDTAGLFRIHQFEKVEQVVICRADEAESRRWHQTMITIVETLLQRLELPHRLVQCCTGDLGPKNADMVDVECWMPSRGPEDDDGRPTGAYGETHSASRLYDYQCRRLNLRYRDPDGGNKTVFCHSLNNTVIASPRILIPILELYQNADASVTVPEALRPHMGGCERIEPAGTQPVNA